MVFKKGKRNADLICNRGIRASATKKKSAVRSVHEQTEVLQRVLEPNAASLDCSFKIPKLNASGSTRAGPSGLQKPSVETVNPVDHSALGGDCGADTAFSQIASTVQQAFISDTSTALKNSVSCPATSSRVDARKPVKRTGSAKTGKLSAGISLSGNVTSKKSISKIRASAVIHSAVPTTQRKPTATNSGQSAVSSDMNTASKKSVSSSAINSRRHAVTANVTSDKSISKMRASAGTHSAVPTSQRKPTATNSGQSAVSSDTNTASKKSVSSSAINSCRHAVTANVTSAKSISKIRASAGTHSAVPTSQRKPTATNSGQSAVSSDRNTASKKSVSSSAINSCRQAVTANVTSAKSISKIRASAGTHSAVPTSQRKPTATNSGQSAVSSDTNTASKKSVSSSAINSCRHAVTANVTSAKSISKIRASAGTHSAVPTTQRKPTATNSGQSAVSSDTNTALKKSVSSSAINSRRHAVTANVTSDKSISKMRASAGTHSAVPTAQRKPTATNSGQSAVSSDTNTALKKSVSSSAINSRRHAVTANVTSDKSISKMRASAGTHSAVPTAQRKPTATNSGQSAVSSDTNTALKKSVSSSTINSRRHAVTVLSGLSLTNPASCAGLNSRINLFNPGKRTNAVKRATIAAGISLSGNATSNNNKGSSKVRPSARVRSVRPCDSNELLATFASSGDELDLSCESNRDMQNRMIRRQLRFKRTVLNSSTGLTPHEDPDVVDSRPVASPLRQVAFLEQSFQSGFDSASADVSVLEQEVESVTFANSSASPQSRCILDPMQHLATPGEGRYSANDSVTSSGMRTVSTQNSISTPSQQDSAPFTSVLSQPLTEVQNASFAAVAQRKKRRKRLSDSQKKRLKKQRNENRYTNNSEEVKARLKKRYQQSPDFVERLVNRVQQYDYYATNRGYRNRANRRIGLSIRKKYSHSSPFRRRVGDRIKQKYQQSSPFRRRVGDRVKEKYQQSSPFRRRVGDRIKQKYRQSSPFRRRVGDRVKDKYRQNSPFRRRVGDRVKDKYRQSSSFRRQVGDRVKQKYAQSSCVRRQAGDRIKQKYCHSIAYRRKVGDRVKQKYKQNKTYRCSVIAAIKNKYRRCNLYRQQVAARAMQRYVRERHSSTRKISNVRSRRKYYAKNAVEISKQRKLKYSRKLVAKAKSLAVACSNVKVPSPLNARRYMRRQSNLCPRLPRLHYASAEARANRFRNWKRFKINNMLARMGINKFPGRKLPAVYRKRKQEVTQLLHQVLNVQRQCRGKFFEHCRKVATVYEHAEEETSGMSPLDKCDMLRRIYGGKQYHVRTMETFGFDVSTVQYKPYSEVIMDKEESCSTSMLDVQVRLCDEACSAQLSCGWEKTLHDSLALISQKFGVEKLLLNVANLERCNDCDLQATALCETAGHCADLLRLLFSLRIHFVGLRTLLRDIYRIRNVAQQLHVIELLLLDGRYADFIAFREQYCAKNAPKYATDDLKHAAECASDTFVLDNYGDLKAQFEEAVEASMEIYTCCCCVRSVRRDKFKTFSPSSAFRKRQDIKSLERAYEDHYSKKIVGDLGLCHSCHGYYRNKKVSPFSDRNFMWPSVVPEEIFCLNSYERLLIALAKNYQKIVKLKPYTYKGPTGTLMRAVKGVSVTLPLPGGTVPKVNEVLAQKNVTLPNCSNLLIELDSMPNAKTANIFRSIVDMSRVVRALQWLITYNPLYKNVKIDTSLIETVQGPRMIFTSDNTPSAYQCGGAADASDIDDTHLESHVVPSKRQIRVREESRFDDNVQPVTSNDTSSSTSQEPISGDMINSVDRNQAATAYDAANARIVATSEEVFNSANRSSSDMCAAPAKLIDKISIKNLRLAKPKPDHAVRSTAQNAMSECTEGQATAGDIMAGGHAADEFVRTLNLPLNYTVPYDRFSKSALADKTSAVMHVPKGGEILEEYSVVNLEYCAPKTLDLNTFALKPNQGEPIGHDDRFVDMATHPHQFPYGTFGVYHKRLQFVSASAYYQHRMKLTDGRFRRDLPYVFDCAQKKHFQALRSSMYSMFNNGLYGNVTAKELRAGAAAPEKSPTLEKNVATLMRHIPGTPQHLLSVRLDLEAFTEEHGPATFFFTASCAEYKQEDYKRFLEIRNTDLPNVSDTSIRNLVAVDPVSVTLHFHNRFEAFWERVIMADKGPLGKVKHYFIRVEYQQRGAPHMHVLLWVSGAPVHGKSEDSEILGFITKHISCTLPDPIRSPELHRLVTQYQMHSCSASCKRKKMVKGKCYCVYCRYGFPRLVSNEARLNTAEAVLEAKARGRNKIKLYDLPRKSSEIMINDYNPAMLLIWGCNIDFQYTHDSRGSLNYYITKYVCKSEKQQMSDLAATINKNLSAAGMAQSMALKLMNSRQIGACEAGDILMGHSIYKISSTVKSAGFYHPKDMRRRLKKKRDVDALPDDSTDVFCRNFQSNYYPKRPADLEGYSAYEVHRQFDYRYGPPPKNKSLYVPEFGICFYKRKEPAVVRLWKPRGNDEDELERYCFQVLALFKPFRDSKELLCGPDGAECATYAEAYRLSREGLPELQRHEKAKERVRSMIEWAEEIERRVEKALEEEVEARPDLLEMDAVQALDDELAAQSKAMRAQLTADLVEANISNLNTEQREIFDVIVKATTADIADGVVINPVRMFVSGVGGTGKSFLIKAIRQYLEYNYSKEGQPAVLVAAPTGVAAANIDGVTIHKLLKLPVSKGSNQSRLLFPLHQMDAKTLRHLFANVKLLIIDEVSMLSNLYLTIVHRRLNEVLIDEDRNPLARFGDLNVLLLGDLLQLPPVLAPHIFKYMTKRQITTCFESIGGNLNLWKLFEFRELTQNMRQRDDLAYSQMLNRIRVGSPTLEDLATLRTRLISGGDCEQVTDDVVSSPGVISQFLRLLEKDRFALCILPRNELVLQFNGCVMTTLQLAPVSFLAIDSMDTTPGGISLPKKQKGSEKMLKRNKKRLLKTAETGGLEEELVLAVGARVMLRRNLDVKSKLVNGSIGYIDDISTVGDAASHCIYVRFQDCDAPVPIARVKSKYYLSGGVYIERSQFPLNLAYAITVHKSQGLSLRSAVLDLGPSTFSAGMAYVALSRVVNLASVHLIRFDGSKVFCDEACVEEYNRLSARNQMSHSIQAWNKNPEIVLQKKTFCVSAKAQMEMLQEEALLENSLRGKRQSSSQAVVPAKKKRTNVIDTYRPGMYLKFTNLDGHSCFANASLQCLLRCHDLYPVLQQHSAGFGDVAEALHGYFNAHSIDETANLSADEIRQSFGGASQYSLSADVNCDPVEFLEDVLRQFPPEVAALFAYNKRFVGTCPNQNCNRFSDVRDDGQQYVERGTVPSLQRYTFADVFSGIASLFYRCPYCDEEYRSFPVTAQYDFQPENRYMILNNPVTYDGRTIEKALTGLVERNLTTFGQRWRFVACIQMHSSSTKTAKGSVAYADDEYRHYTAFVRHQAAQWVHLNDTSQHILGRRPVLRNMVLLLLERVLH